jgi:hypothetical protein
MTIYAADPSLTLGASRDLYFEVNGFGADGGYSDAWVDFKLGPVPMPFPNTASRVRAVRFHDLHHVLTAYGTDTLGEFEISAWELASGCADHTAAWQLNLLGMLVGTIASPRRILRAFVRGRRSKNLYRATYDETLLSRRVGEMRAELGLDRDPGGASASDAVLFAFYLVVGLVLGAFASLFFIPIAIFANVSALFRRPRASVAKA